MQLTKLSVQGFKSFKSQQEFTFPTEPGLYFIGGKNLVDKELEANGSGKSSFLDALCWVLYGKTSTGLKAGDVASWGREFPCVVSVDFEMDGDSFTVTRTWSPNSLKVSVAGEAPEIWDQDAVDDLLGLNMEAFLRTVLFSQFGSYFFDSKPAEKTKIMTPILDLEVWDTASATARSNSSQLQGSVNDTEKLISEIEGYIKGQELLDYKDDLEDWDYAHKEKTRAIAGKLSEGRKTLADLKIKVKADLKSLEELEEMRKAYDEGKGDLQKRIDKDREVVAESRSHKAVVISNLKSVQQTLTDLETLSEEGTCQRCGQAISEEHIEKESALLFEEFEEFEEKERAILVSLEILQERLDDSLKAMEDFEVEGVDLIDTVQEVKVSLGTLKHQTLQANTLLGQANKDLVALEDLVNPYINKQKDLEAQRASSVKELADNGKYLLDLQAELSRSEYWVGGFKKLRLFVMKEILSQFSMEVNNALQALGLEGWEIKLLLDKENKSGSIKNEFTVFVKGPENESFVNWESWSGGERQRLRFAGSLGLANLIKSSKGVDVKFEFYDEPTSFLSEKGIQGELVLLKERAIADRKVVMLIDHKNMQDFEFTGSYMVTKDDEGSRFGSS